MGFLQQVSYKLNYLTLFPPFQFGLTAYASPLS